MSENKKEFVQKADKKIRRVLIISVSIAVAVFILAGLLFTVFSPRAVMELEGVRVDRKMYSYWVSYFKNQLMVEYGISGSNDKESFWQSEYKDGVSYEQHFSSIIDSRIKAKVVGASMYDAFGQPLPDYASEDISTYLFELIEYVGDGNRKSFDKKAAEYGTDYGAIKRVAVCDYKVELLFNLLYGGDGSYITDKEKQEFYKNNYSRVKTIFINTKDENLSTEELNAKNAMIAKLDEIISEGVGEEQFDSLIEVYSDDRASSYYKNGFYLSKTSDYPIREVLEEALSMKVDECKRVDSDYGVHYIFKLELDDGAYDKEENSDWFADFEYQTSLLIFDKAVKAKTELVKVNGKEKSKVSFTKIKHNYEIKPLMN